MSARFDRSGETEPLPSPRNLHTFCAIQLQVLALVVLEDAAPPPPRM